MLEIMADLECALVLTSEHNPTATVCSFVDSAIQFKRLRDFLHSVQHMPKPAPEARTAIARKVAAYEDALSKLGKQEVHARGILNFAKSEMLEVLDARGEA